MSTPRAAIILNIFLLFFLSPAVGQNTDTPLKVFLECPDCNNGLIIQEVDVVDYVRDQNLADIHIFVTRVQSGSGGRNYTLSFIGKKAFSGQEHSFDYAALPTQSRIQDQEVLVEKIKLGLVPFLIKTSFADRLNLSLAKAPEKEENKNAQLEDRWSFWVFEVFANGRMNRESRRNSFNIRYGADADRITQMWRIRLNSNFSFQEDNFIGDSTVFTSFRRSSFASGSVVKSINNHWSAGFFTSANSATFDNIETGIGIFPALEYSFLPYEEAMRKEITIAYRTGYLFRDYIEETVYGKMGEHLWRQSLDINVRIRQPWGSVFAGIEGSNFFHDWEKNRLELDARVNLRIFNGLAVRFSGNFELINDQLSLPKGDFSLEDILLQQRQLDTDYDLFLSVGVSYTFGSIYNNVINTRL
jgi:hypothetical protein